MIDDNLRKLFRYQEFPHVFQTFARTIARSNSYLLQLHKTKLIKLIKL